MAFGRNFENSLAFEILQNKFHLEFFNGSHRVVCLFDSSTKSTIVYVFIVLLTDHRHLIVQYIFLYIWDIAATAESTSGRRLYALFKYVLHYPQGNERTGDSIFLGRRHNSCWTHSPQTQSCNISGGVLELFSRFCRGTKNRGFIQIEKFFPRHISNTK